MKFLQVASLSLLVETTLSIERTARIRASKNSLNRRKKNAIGTGMDLMGRNRTGTRNGFKSKFNARDKSNFDLGVLQSKGKGRRPTLQSKGNGLRPTLQSKGKGGRPNFNANRPPIAATEECEETIYCEKGLVFNGTEYTSCAVACEGECCSGEKACDSFTGRVCKDSVSCQGNYSCAYAYIDYIHQGCDEYKSCYGAGSGYEGYPIEKVQNGCRGESACYAAGFEGNINEIVNGCEGFGACAYAAAGYTDYYGYYTYRGSIGTIRDSCSGNSTCYKAGFGGNIGEIVNGCEGFKACAYAAGYGSIGTISDSCKDRDACYQAGYDGNINEIENSCQGDYGCFFAGYGGSIGTIRDSCKGGAGACDRLADYGGTVGDVVEGSCLGEFACYRVAYGYYASIGNIADSCVGGSACAYAGRYGEVDEFTSSCEGDEACFNLAYQGLVGGVRSACNADVACKNAGSYSMDIPSGIDSCCNEVGECESVSEATLPADCPKAPTTSPPTQSPTKVTTKSPTKVTTKPPTPSPMKTMSPTGKPTKSPTAGGAGAKSAKTAKSKTVKSGKTGKSSKASTVAAREQALHMSLSLGEEPSSMSFLFI